jgi:hypothetical protein
MRLSQKLKFWESRGYERSGAVSAAMQGRVLLTLSAGIGDSNEALAACCTCGFLHQQ